MPTGRQPIKTQNPGGLKFTWESKQKLAERYLFVVNQKIARRTNKSIQKAEKFRRDLENVPVAIAIIFERDAAERVPEWQEIAAVSMAVQNMWLTATGLGLGAFWSTPEFLPLLNDILEIQPAKIAWIFLCWMTLPWNIRLPGRGDIAEK
jgi:nitroreductase